MKKIALYLFLLTMSVLAAVKMLGVSAMDAEEHRKYRQEQERLAEREAAIQYLKEYGNE
jgi:hypothetical protein